MELEDPLLCSQEPDCGPGPDTGESNSLTHTHTHTHTRTRTYTLYFVNIIPPSAPESVNRSLPFRFSD
jgi:hypothetical protein